MKKEYISESKRQVIISRLEYTLNKYVKVYSKIIDKVNYLKNKIEEFETNCLFGVEYEVVLRELSEWLVKENDYNLFIKDLRVILCQEENEREI